MEPKKNPEIDTTRQMPVFWTTGLVVALVMVITAFEWPSYDEVVDEPIEIAMGAFEEEEILEIPPTVQVPPPPTPVIQEPELVEVPDEKEIEKEVEMPPQDDETPPINTSDIPTTTTAKKYSPPVEKEDPNQIFEVVEKQASFPGGYAEFLKYLKKNINYPSQAKRANVQGRVNLRFVVEKDGSITDIEVIRGIGAGCDEEAVRVLKASPKWTPAEQRNKPVRVRMVIPVTFTLR